VTMPKQSYDFNCSDFLYSLTTCFFHLQNCSRWVKAHAREFHTSALQPEM
jgi:hypothetical protein